MNKQMKTFWDAAQETDAAQERWRGPRGRARGVKSSPEAGGEVFCPVPSVPAFPFLL